jgi:hypothetical protein
MGASLNEPVLVRSTTLAYSRFGLTATGGLDSTPSDLELQVQGVDLELQTGDKPELVSLSLPLGDVNVSATALPPHGLELRDISLHVPQPAPARVVVATEDAVEITVHTPLLLRWRMVLDDGSTWALGPTRTEALDLDVSVARVGDGYTAALQAHCPDECFALDGVVALRAGQLDLAANADVIQTK